MENEVESNNSSKMKFLQEEKQKGVVSLRMSRELVRVINSNENEVRNYDIIETGGKMVDDGETIDGVYIVSSIRNVSLNGFKMFLVLCRFITEERHIIFNDFKEKYENTNNIRNNEKRIKMNVLDILINHSTDLEIPFDTILKMLGKNVNKRNRYELKEDLKRSKSSKFRTLDADFDEGIESFVYDFRTKIVNGERKIFKHMVDAEINEKRKSIIFTVNDLFIYYMMNDYIMLQVTDDLMKCKKLDIINLSIYISSFKYNNRYSYANNVINIETMLKKIGKTKEDYEHLALKDFLKEIRRIFKTAITKIDKDATFKVITKNYKTLSSVIKYGKIEFNMPVFEQGRTNYNKVKSMMLKEEKSR